MAAPFHVGPAYVPPAPPPPTPPPTDCGTWYEQAERPHVPQKRFRKVTDYGAKGDASTDDSAAITRALTDARPSWRESTQNPAVVFFPAGHYMISNTLPNYM